MNPSANPLYSQLLFLSGSISLLVMAIAWKRRHVVSSALPMAVFSFANALWGLFYALHWTNFPRFSEFFWLDMSYFGVVMNSPSFLVFALFYTGLSTYLTKGVKRVLIGIPLLTLFFLWTDPQLGIFFAGKRQVGASLIYDGGLGFWLFVLYSYGLIFLSILIVLQAVFRFPKKYQGQIGVILLGVSLPILTNALTFLGLNPLPELDLTPITFSLTGVFFSIAIFRYEFLDLMPVSRDIVFETHRDAILVLDIEHRVVDANRYANDIFVSEVGKSLLGCSFSELQEHFTSLSAVGFVQEEERFEIVLEAYQNMTFEMLVSPLKKQNANEAGAYILTFHDISEQKEAERIILGANQKLREQLEKIQALQNQLREEAIRDHLTGLYNRRYLHEVLLQYLEPARRRSRTISFALLDIDHFKQVNDTYGHDIGDEALVSFSKFLVENTRRDDTVCRFGGEEFLIVFADTNKDDAVKRVESWLKGLADYQLSQTITEVQVSFSCGIVSLPEDGENMDTLFKKADDRLYQAKEAGRNQIVAA